MEQPTLVAPSSGIKKKRASAVSNTSNPVSHLFAYSDKIPSNQTSKRQKKKQIIHHFVSKNLKRTTDKKRQNKIKRYRQFFFCSFLPRTDIGIQIKTGGIYLNAEIHKQNKNANINHKFENMLAKMEWNRVRFVDFTNSQIILIIPYYPVRFKYSVDC